MTLPRWATLIPRDPSAGQDPVSLPEEEAYVRTRCFHQASRALDAAFKASLDGCARGIIINNHNKLLVCNKSKQQQQQQDDRMGPPLRKRCRTESSKNDANDSSLAEQGETAINDKERSQQTIDNTSSLRLRFSFQPSTSFDPHLLPVHLLSGPSHALDRLAWMKHLVDTARHDDTRGAIVWLQQGPPTSWVTEIIRQLYILEPPTQRAGLKRLSVTENLTHWCRSTLGFQFIQIFVDMQTVHSATAPVNQFLHWLAHGRANHGIPFSVVLLESSGPRRHDICSYQQGTDGMVLHRHALPSPTTLLKDLLLTNHHHGMVTDLVTVLFPPGATVPENNNDGDGDSGSTLSAVAPLWTTFDSTGSTVLALLEWKRRLANHLSSPGSFLTLDCDNWLSKERRRLEWLLSSKHLKLTRILKDESAFDLANWRDQARFRRNMAVLSWQIRHVVVQRCRLQPPTVDLWKNLTDRKPYLEVLGKARSAATLDKRNSSSSSSSSSLLLAALNELIILLDNCTNLRDVLNCLDAYHQDWSDCAQQLRLRLSINDFPRPAQPRRDLVEGLHSDMEAVDISSVPGTLYRFLNHRVSIGFSEWMQLFSDQPICLDLDPSEAVAFFSAGVNMLKVQGLIRERKMAGRNDPVFDKTAVVFSV